MPNPANILGPKNLSGRSLGLKLLLVCGLVLLMGIPAIFISIVSYERSGRADETVRDVSLRYGGKQTIMGPILVAPYVVIGDTDAQGKRHIARGEYVVFAENGSVKIPDLTTEEKKRSLYKVTTYKAGVNFEASFKLPEGENQLDEQIDWSQAKILIGMSNVRGLRDDVFLTLSDGTKRKFAPALAGTFKSIRTGGQTYSKFSTSYGGVSQSTGLQYMSVSVADLMEAGSLNVSAALPLSGAQDLSIIPFAQSSKARVISDWPHPGFGGAFPPTDREITDDGFMAEWSVPLMARGLAARGPAHAINLGELNQNTMQVSLVQKVNAYQKVNRALKYAIMFIGLVFLSYFLFEVMIGVRVHAAQYVLIGLAQCIFYLLLLAFSEHVGFALAFFIAAAATVIATAGYAGAVFGGQKYAIRAGAVFLTVYGLLYVLMQIEDFALMVGAVTSFLAIAGTMYLTRNIDWYGMSEKPATPQDLSQD